MRPLNVLGLNSGTSMDGIDAAAFTLIPLGPANDDAPPRIQAELLHSELIPYEELFSRNLSRLVNSGEATLKEICLLNASIGRVFADASLTIMKALAGRGEQIDLIGSHGQTIWHEPIESRFWETPVRGTLQLGDASIIAASTRKPVVYDFRTDDMAWGGQGAPLVSFADEVLFGHLARPLAVLNIGGIANLTLLGRSGRAICAFDSGPGNMLIDRFCQTLFGKSVDTDGAIAASARERVDKSWLEELLSHPYYGEIPPKTTGREIFGHSYADKLLEEAKHRKLDSAQALATITALTARSIAAAYSDLINDSTDKEKSEILILGGGGAANKTLVSMLEEAWPHPVEIVDHEFFGISTKFKESLLFALLAYTTYFQVPNNVPVCTGASKRVCLGKIARS